MHVSLPEDTLAWMPCNTYKKHMDAHHYACVNVLSDWIDHCMPCYKHLKHKGAHNYARVDVL
jgi:hypothetical protein